jgi:hypothetical protein
LITFQPVAAPGARQVIDKICGISFIGRSGEIDFLGTSGLITIILGLASHDSLSSGTGYTQR